jgi:hypothetical protein
MNITDITDQAIRTENLTESDIEGLSDNLEEYQQNQFANIIDEYMKIHKCDWATANKWLCLLLN